MVARPEVAVVPAQTPGMAVEEEVAPPRAPAAVGVRAAPVVAVAVAVEHLPFFLAWLEPP